jgi:23S rRNA (guanine745-N1)-methyltransferase
MNEPERCAGYLSCPVCGGSLTAASGSARCAQGHSFDYARSGYLNLTRTGGGRARAGDTAAMVEARAGFLAGGHYERIAAAVGDAAADAGGPAARVLAEIGSGTGYYLAAAADRLRAQGADLECAVGFDLSKAAASHAARRHDDLEFVVADVETAIPLRDSVADVALSVFSPRPAAELGRTVQPGGELVVAFADPRHLERLRKRLDLISVHEDKLERLSERLQPWFDPVSTSPVEYAIELGAEDARRLVEMGPNARHGFDAAALDEGLDDLVSVQVGRFRRHG